MLGSGNSTPYDLPLLAILVGIALLLVIGAATPERWPDETGAWIRRVALAVATAAMIGVHMISPTSNGMIGAGRLLTLWPAYAVVILAYLVWALRVGKL